MHEEVDLSFSKHPLNSLLNEFASSKPTPGGGSAAALSSSLGASLIAMASAITANSKKFADRKERMDEICGEANILRERLLELVTLDASAYDTFTAARRLPKDTDEQKARRDAAMQDAMKSAAEIPFETLSVSIAAMKLAVEVVENGNPVCVTDAVAGALLLEAGLNAAKMNICVNLDGIADEDYCTVMKEKVTIARNEVCFLSNRMRIIHNSHKECSTK